MRGNEAEKYELRNDRVDWGRKERGREGKSGGSVTSGTKIMRVTPSEKCEAQGSSLKPARPPISLAPPPRTTGGGEA